MPLFSERYGYTHPSDVIIREKITPEIQNAICSCYDVLQDILQQVYYANNAYLEMEKFIWTYFLNNRVGDFSHQIVVTPFIENDKIEWYRKLDMLEITINYLNVLENKRQQKTITKTFIERLNSEFERLNFAYRVVDNKIIEITSKEEIDAIEDVLTFSDDNIRMHLNKALKLYAQRPIGDYSNSIKESITAVEAYGRELTGDNTLGESLKHLEKNGIVIHPILKAAFQKLYDYTNQPEIGSRHALLDGTGTYLPKAEEAELMLVACSAFLNYLRKK